MGSGASRILALKPVGFKSGVFNLMKSLSVGVPGLVTISPGKINVVFYPRKGLFTKFYCVANQTEMNDAAGNIYRE